ncbi:hypothetical protein [Neisseria weixii]|uniref:hypothetical protein n=1 Tax=Neisseria weixii TaxID=1853276 RepID=UPI0035A127F2
MPPFANGSLPAAAWTLGRARSDISQSIANLEIELGGNLISIIALRARSYPAPHPKEFDCRFVNRACAISVHRNACLKKFQTGIKTLAKTLIESIRPITWHTRAKPEYAGTVS